MAVSTRNPAPRAVTEPETRNVGRELVYEVVFRRPAATLVPAFVRLRVPPPAIVLAHAGVGLAAAAVLADGRFVLAAILLQLKTLLDNVDGSLARASRNVTLSGRYLDTEADFVVNAALFVALASATGSPYLALSAFIVLTLVLTVNFQLLEQHREAWGRPPSSPPPAGGWVERALANAYGVVFAPQDRLVRALSQRRFDRLASRTQAPPELRNAALRDYYDRRTVDLVANLGLSTQLAVLGLCLAAGVPELYLWLVLVCPVVVAVVQARRERLALRSLAGR